MNVYRPHIVVIPEDDANRELVNGFVGQLHWSKQRYVGVEPVAGGWQYVIEVFKSLIPTMHKYPARNVMLVMDFDGQVDERRQLVQAATPDTLATRVFLLGSKVTPEVLAQELGASKKCIGENLAKACAESDAVGLAKWREPGLMNNAAEVARLNQAIRPLLF